MSLPPPQKPSSPATAAAPPLAREREISANRTPPLTDPADLFTLLGRMVVCLVLAALTVALLFRQAILPALFVGSTSIFVQRLTYKLWKRLRDERMEKEAALLAPQNTGDAEGNPAP